jgi:hypothetical protein
MIASKPRNGSAFLSNCSQQSLENENEPTQSDQAHWRRSNRLTWGFTLAVQLQPEHLDGFNFASSQKF